ncbi:MAG: glutamate-1-semialdehyde 2,1-aminomutase [Phycisphaerales bacterium]|nr:glutamate-1-semialdehyde 2,1-aminomutase [Phycisphaerales bacterium]
MSRSEELHAEAARFIPGGVNSPVRAFRAVGGAPRFITRATGCHMYDADGNAYIDYICGYGPLILGHSHPAIIEAVERALRDGTCFGAPTQRETQLAQAIVERVPSIEQVRMVNSGTEAVMSAIRLARAATKRERIIKFAGCYHGHADYLLVQAGSGASTLGTPDSPGVTAGSARDTLSARYNDLDQVADLFAAHTDEIAAVIVEPVAGNMGVVPPADGFLQGLRDLTQENGALLIFDEVMTGFRVHRGGAQALYNVTPDLTVLGKIIGGGLPVGAYGGPARLMQQIAPAGPVYQAGTLSGNPLAMAAGLATLNALDDDAYRTLEQTAATLESGLRDALARAKVPAAIQRVGSMLSVFFADAPVQSYDDAKAANHPRFAAFFNAMLEHGVHLPPSGYEAWFVSLAHDDTAIAETVSAAVRSL